MHVDLTSTKIATEAMRTGHESDNTEVTEFTDKDALKAYLKRKRGTFNRPLVYRIDDGNGPVIMTLSRVLRGGLDAPSRRHRS